VERRAQRRRRREQYLDPKAERGRGFPIPYRSPTSADVANCIRPGEDIDGARAGGAEAKRTLGSGLHRATGAPSMGDHGQFGLVEELREKRPLTGLQTA